MQLSVRSLSFIKQPICYKNPDKPSCIDLILTVAPQMFTSIDVTETGLSNFHLMTECYEKNIKRFDLEL